MLFFYKSFCLTFDKIKEPIIFRGIVLGKNKIRALQIDYLSKK